MGEGLRMMRLVHRALDIVAATYLALVGAIVFLLVTAGALLRRSPAPTTMEQAYEERLVRVLDLLLRPFDAFPSAKGA